jgi:hypothetical protein
MNCLALNANMLFDEKSLELMYKILASNAEVHFTFEVAFKMVFHLD